MSKFKAGDIFKSTKSIETCRTRGEVYTVNDIIDGKAEYKDDSGCFVLLGDESSTIKIPNPNDSEDASERQVGGSHYAKLAIQPFTYAFHNNLNCGQFNALKYITRYKDKNGIEDLKKAIHCIELLIQHEEENNA